MIIKVYEKNGISVEDDYIEHKMQEKGKVEQFIRLYKQEELESMNYIFGKPYDNKFFTEIELEAASKINLFNKKVVELCKKIWEREMKEGVSND